MAKQFPIYIPNNKFYLTPNTIFLGVIILIIILHFALKSIGYTLDDQLPLMIIANVICFAILFILRITQPYQTEPLLGKLNGFIEIAIGGITINEKLYPFSLINNIEITANDFLNNQLNDGILSLNQGLSNGTYNKIIITLYDKQVIKIQFQQKEKDELLSIKTILIEYYKAKKLPFTILAKVLKFTNKEDIERFKKSIS